MIRFILTISFLISVSQTWSQDLNSPLEKRNFSSPTSYTELTEYIQFLDKYSEKLTVKPIGISVQGRAINALMFSSGGTATDTSKLKVLIFSQQHGNEQSGKEGALLLAKALCLPENQYLLNYLDVAIIPQVNPDGAEINRRRNGNNRDLNRNHLILTEPEVIALHRFFDSLQFQVNMDVHEYAPFGETWRNFGYRNNSYELIGCNTNINIASSIREFSNQSFVPFYKKYLDERGVSNSVYAPGGPPEQDYIRHSTFDINDGRQSFGILNSLSFIQEGLNGTDNFKDSLQQRATGQFNGMMALLEFCNQNHSIIKKMVDAERTKLLTGEPGKKISVQMEHATNGTRLALPVYSYATGRDSMIMVADYRPVIHSITDVEKPEGYLIPVKETLLTDWVQRYGLQYQPYVPHDKDQLEQYAITTIDSIDFERDTIINPVVQVNTISKNLLIGSYWYIPLNQLKGTAAVIALEPKSELGLVTYESFSSILKKGEVFPVIRVIKKYHK